MFCCVGLKNLVGNAGARGLSVLVRNTSYGLKFSLQSRGLAKEDEARALSESHKITFTINFANDVGLIFCPFCGTEIATLITASSRKHFEELAHKHEVFDPPNF
jgi:hypothetical protein